MLSNVSLAIDKYLIEVSITIIGDERTMDPAFSFYVQNTYSTITHCRYKITNQLENIKTPDCLGVCDE